VQRARQPARVIALDGDGLKVGASGTVNPKSQALAGRLTVDSARGAAWLARLGLPGVRIGEAHVAGQIAGTLARPEVDAKLRAADVSVENRNLESAEADLEFRGGAVKVSGLHGAGLGASVDGDATLTLFDARGDLGHRLREPTLTAHLSARGVDIGALAGWKDLAGRAEASLDVEGPLTEPRGRAELRVPKLSVRGDPYVDGHLLFDLGQGKATVRALNLQRRAGGTLSGAGDIDWKSGQIDLRITPRDFPIPAIPGVERAPVALDGTLSGAFRLLGDWAAPQLDGLLSLVGFKFRDTLFGDGHLRALPGGDATRIQGKFFGDKVEVDGYLTMVPKLTVVATIKFTDIALEKILPEMRKLAEVRGIASGEVKLSLDASSGLTFASLRMGKLELTLSATDEDGRPRHLVVRNQDDVLVQSDGSNLRVDRARLTSPIGNFDMHGTIAQQNCDVQLKGDIGMELLEYFFRSAFDHTHGDAYVDLSIKGNLERPDLNGSITIRKPARLEPRGMEKFFIVPSGRVDFTPTSIALKNFQVSMDGSVAQASGFVELDHWVPGQIAADVSGELSPLFLQWLVPEQVAEASGRLAVNVHVGGRWSQPEWQGSAEVKGITAQLRNFPQEIALKSGTVRFVNYDLVLDHLAGSLDDHPISARGTIRLKEGGLREVNLALEGEELTYANPDQFSIAVSPRVKVTGDDKQLTLSGRIDINEGRYSQSWGDLRDFVIRPRVVEKTTPFWQGVPLLETMKLNLRAQSTAPLAMQNGILQLTADLALDIGGTLSEPSFNGTVTVQEGGKIHIPGAKTEFTAEQSAVHFDPEKRMPDETPTFDLRATGTLTDANDNQHNLLLTVTGVWKRPLLKLTAPQEGWEPQEAFIALFAGKTPNQIRQQLNNTTQGFGAGPAVSGSISDNLAKTITGLGLGDVISDPIRKLFGFDTTSLEFSTASVDVRVCKRFTRNLKTCGYGEVGFAGASRGQGSLELRVSDWVSGSLRAEYVTPGVNTLEDVSSRMKLELKFQFPLGN
jgi:autotransporter translocation and assembly factor TamB